MIVEYSIFSVVQYRYMYSISVVQYRYMYSISVVQYRYSTPGLHNKIPAHKMFARVWVAQKSLFFIGSA